MLVYNLSMKIVITVKEIRKIVQELRQENKSIGFVPTMGALHAGHLRLVKESKNKNDVTIVSVFVNPKQFGPKEDLTKYPRPFEQDKKLLEQEKVDYLFYPNSKEIYPNGFQTSIIVNELSKILEGKSRPTHFAGVSTIVLKLFNLINPTNAYFGQKDFQQCIVIKHMIKDLNLSIKINTVPTVRDKDGLALSSRNIYLNTQERVQATALYKSLQLAKQLIKSGNKNSEKIKKEIKKYLQKYKLVNLDFVEICDLNNLLPVKEIENKVVVLIEAYVGKTRLIDNILI